jgi:hypothetical protein
MHALISGLLENFATAHGLDKISSADKMEYFTDFCALAPMVDSESSFTDAHLGASEFGIDGLAIVVNGRIVLSIEDVDEVAGDQKSIDVNLVFTQAKTSESLETGELSKFLSATEGFLAGDKDALKTDGLKSAYAAFKRVFSYAAKFRRETPTLSCYFAFTGRASTIGGEANLIKRQFLERVETLDYFKSTSVEFLGRQELQDRYRRLSASLEKQVEIERTVSLPSIDGVSEAYIGVIPALELKQLISDDSGDILGAIFYENIRDFDPRSKINESIKETFSKGNKKEFVLRNNGITVLCPNLRKVGDTFHLVDFQIINGCQTSHVVHSCEDDVLKDAHVPIKLVSTTDENISSAIIIASNQQNEVKFDQFWSLRSVHKEYEEFFRSYNSDQPLFYERRRNQYARSSDVEKVRIVIPSNLARQFSAVFQSNPHNAARYIKAIYSDVEEGKIFNEDHKSLAYYTAAYLAYRLEYLFRNSYIETDWKSFRHSMIHGFKVAIVGDEDEDPASRKIEKMSKELLAVAYDNDRSLEVFEQVVRAMKSILRNNSEFKMSRDTARLVTFRDEMIRKLS